MDKKESLNYIHKTLYNREIEDYKFDINNFIKATEILYQEYTRLMTDNYILSEREKQHRKTNEYYKELIKKQQKELESLKEDNKKKSIVIIEYQDLYEKLQDKIKAILNTTIRYATDTASPDLIQVERELKSLLEKE